METMEIPIQNEMDVQTYLEQKYPTLADKVNCEFLNLGTKDESNPNGLEIKLIGSLDLTGFTNLKLLMCNEQKLTGLNLPNSLQLEYLFCQNNELTELDMSNCSQLKALGCGTNKLIALDLSNCEKLAWLNCRENQLTHLDLRQSKNLTELYCEINQLTNLEIKSPILTKLYCYNNQLSTLDLTNCSQLIEIGCHQNQLIQLTFPPRFSNLEKLFCSDNFLTDLDWASLSGEKLTVLFLQDNNFVSRDLRFLARFTNLRELYLSNVEQAKFQQGIYNRWTGSLQPLQNMKRLHTLHINNTDLENGTEYLPVSVMEITCSYFLRPDSKVKLVAKKLEQSNDFILVSSLGKLYLKKKIDLEILNQIKEFDHEKLTPEQEILLEELIPSKQWRHYYKEYCGLCNNCQQLNGNGEWCQSCITFQLEANFANWTSGNLEIDKLIQKCQLEAKGWNNVLEWIPYEHFFDIEHLANGGFGKVYKARWIDGILKGWNTKDNRWERFRNADGNVNVILKALTNSQNMTAEFFQEIINHKLVAKDATSFIVDFFGISQEPETGNYVMVMIYMKEGNLRQLLQRNYKQLNFPKRLNQLLTIAQGLESIHEAGLVHQDFHAGNVLNRLNSDNDIDSYIADLGLSRPASETNKKKVYGVLPYVAPEVLREKKYTQASDIYFFGMIAYELFSNQPPFAEYVCDSVLAFRICEGLRPNLQEVIAPQLLKDLISRCWDAQPEQRPTVSEIWIFLKSWLDDMNDAYSSLRKENEFYYQYQNLLATKQLDSLELDSLTSKQPLNCSVEKSISQLLDFENLPEPVNSKELNEQFYNSQEVDVDISKKFVNLEEKTISQEVDLIDNFADLNIQTDPQEESSTQVQIQIPPKQN